MWHVAFQYCTNLVELTGAAVTRVLVGGMHVVRTVACTWWGRD